MKTMVEKKMNKFIRATVLSLFLMLATFSISAQQQAYATATLLPAVSQPFYWPSGSAFAGQPLAGGQVFTYAAGTTTPLASYTDSTALVQNSNPIILDSNGRANIWISGAYKIVVEDPNGNVLGTTDNVQDLFTYDNIQSTSTTSLAVQNGSPLTLTTQSGKYFGPGVFVMIVNSAAPTADYMHCPITSYVGTQLTCTPDGSLGSGTFASWNISLSGPLGPAGPTGPSGGSAGDMIGADNLSVGSAGAGGITNAATARGNLGLGSAAVLNAGTGASQVVQLDGSGNLPAVSGVNLTNVAGVPAVATNSAGGYTFSMGAVLIETGQAPVSTTTPSITFPTAFSGTPLIFPVPVDSMVIARQTATSTTGFTLALQQSSQSGNYNTSVVNWMAIGQK